MTKSKKFNIKKLEKLNNPERLKSLNPELILESLNLSTPEVIVDIGAGTGFFASHFAKIIKQGTIYAFDTSDVMIDYMKENLPQVGSCKIIPVKSQENKIPLDNNIADLVYLINVYHELEEPKKLVLETKRILKKGGKIAIIDWDYKETPDGPPLEHRIQAENITKLLKEIGFSDIYKNNLLPYHYLITAIS